MQFDRNAIMLVCSDVPRAREFYQQHLALEVDADIGWFVSLRKPKSAPSRFELSLCELGHESLPPGSQGPTNGLVLAFQVESADNEAERLTAAGVELLTEVKNEPWGQRHFFASAPDGVVLDVFQLVPPDPEWMRAHGFG